MLVLLCAVVLAVTRSATRERIEHNRAARFADSVRMLTADSGSLPAVRWRNDLWHLCNGKALIRGSSMGYGGPVHWLAAIDVAAPEPRLLGLKVTAHQETPGIADFLTREQDPWMHELANNTRVSIRQVDTLTGATITSRAVLAAAGMALAHPDLEIAQCNP